MFPSGRFIKNKPGLDSGFIKQIFNTGYVTAVLILLGHYNPEDQIDEYTGKCNAEDRNEHVGYTHDCRVPAQPFSNTGAHSGYHFIFRSLELHECVSLNLKGVLIHIVKCKPDSFLFFICPLDAVFCICRNQQIITRI